MTMHFTEAMRLAVFASGGGSNFQAVLEAIDRGDLPAAAVLCVTNKPNAGVLQYARSANVAQFILPPNVRDGNSQAELMLEALRDADVNFVALAGYMKLVPAKVVRAFRGRMTNIHPALLPSFGGTGMYGRHVHQAVLEYGVRWTGVTVHLVDESYDTGPVVLQEPIPVAQDDTVASLAERVLEAEHRLYPEALRLFAEGRVIVEGRKVQILDFQREV